MSGEDIPIEPAIAALIDATVDSLFRGHLNMTRLRQSMEAAYRCGWSTGKMKGLDRGLEELERISKVTHE